MSHLVYFMTNKLVTKSQSQSMMKNFMHYKL